MTNDLAWAAGLFEGEGCISRGSVGYPRLQLVMTDEDVVRRFHKIIGRGNVNIRRPVGPFAKKISWEWSSYTQADIQEVMFLLWDYLGERRQAKAIELGIEP